MPDQMCPPRRRPHLLLLTAVAPLLVFSVAEGQSVALRYTAAARTLDAICVYTQCGKTNPACADGAAAA